MTLLRCSDCGLETTTLSDGICETCGRAREQVVDFMEAVARRLRCMEPGCSARKRFDVTTFGRIVARQPAGKNIYCGLHVRRVARLLRRDQLRQAA